MQVEEIKWDGMGFGLIREWHVSWTEQECLCLTINTGRDQEPAIYGCPFQTILATLISHTKV